MKPSSLSFCFFVSILLLIAPASAHYYLTDEQTGMFTSLTMTKEPPIAGEKVIMEFSIMDSSYEPIRKDALDVVHERKLHVFVIGKDLTSFSHIHAEDYAQGFEYEEQGAYGIEYTFPKAGEYAIVAYYTIGGVTVGNTFQMIAIGSPQMEKPKKDFGRKKEFDGYMVSLDAPKKIYAGEEVELAYTIEKGGKPVDTLQLLLGSEMHVVTIKDDFSATDHVHAYRPGHFIHVGKMAQYYKGPTIPIRTTFTQSGTYAVFSQFMDNGKVTTTKFMVKVSERGKMGNGAKIALGLLIALLVCGAACAAIWKMKKGKARTRKGKSGKKRR